MRNQANPRTILTLLVTLALALIPGALAQEPDPFEYLVVSYGETLFSNPLLSADSANATFSKVQLFSDIGVTIPNEAINLQRNIDVLGQFGWEMITIVGTIGGDQQIVFKRPYDAERSAQEAERIKAERERLIAAYNAPREEATTDTEEKPQLIELDAVERAQATNARNERDAAAARKLVDAATNGFQVSALGVSANAFSPDGDAKVSVRITQDVTNAALVAPGQYRQSLVTDAVEQLKNALVSAGFTEAQYSLCGIGRGEPRGQADVSIKAIINHDNTSTEIRTYHYTLCF